MEELRKLVEELERKQEEKSIIEKLQKINAMILTKCMLKVDDSYILYPTEVEAYFYKDPEFKDECVHCNELQRGASDRFGKLYFHRKGKDSEIRFYNYAGIDVCLSLDKSYYLGILIRNAYINDGAQICGPSKLVWEVVDHICYEDNIKKLSQDHKVKICKLEDQLVLMQTDAKDKRIINPIFVTHRKGITKGDYIDSPLRSFIELKQEHADVKKEKILLEYFKKENINVTEDLVVDILGYKSKAILDSFIKN
ncbi:MAG: hypothetical protein PHI48_04445 [Bacteroidales bacterium]|nr:hypothetical protein [Bacteroidales bacterium]